MSESGTTQILSRSMKPPLDIPLGLRGPLPFIVNREWGLFRPIAVGKWCRPDRRPQILGDARFLDPMLLPRPIRLGSFVFKEFRNVQRR